MSSVRLDMSRLPLSLKREHMLISVQFLSRDNPASVKFIAGSMKAMRKKQITKSQFMTCLQTHFGQTLIDHAFSVSSSAITKKLMENHVLVDLTENDTRNSVCHACLSYEAQLTCELCDDIRFCLGCADYGPCSTCVPECE